MGFHVGQKVVRIGGTPNPASNRVAPPVDVVCVVSWVGPAEQSLAGEAIDLLEFPAPATAGFHRGFNAYYFRPVIERKTETGFSVLEEIRKRESFEVHDHQRERRTERAG